MPPRARNTKRSPGSPGEDRVLKAIRAGFAGQARTSARTLTAIHRTNENVEEFSRNVNRMILQLSLSIDRMAQALVEQGARMEAMNRRIDENTAAIRENTVALLQIADAIRGSSGDGRPQAGA